MRGVLYIAHGTRVKEGVQQAIDFIERVKSKIDVPIQQISFLEFTSPSIEQGVDLCVQKGATEIAVVPILLLAAKHAKEDIPRVLENIQKRYPKIRFSYGKPFGIDNRLVRTLYDRIVSQQIPLESTAEVLLIGRGSSDESVLHEFREIASRLKLKHNLRNVGIAFLYGNGPQFVDFLKQLKLQSPHQVFIVPYLLFTGLLRKEIEKQLSFLKDKQNIIICESLGYDERVQQVLVDRTRETLALLNSTEIEMSAIFKRVAIELSGYFN